MNLNLNQSNVTLDDAKFETMLQNLQANILKGHGRDFATHLFFSFKKEQISDAKFWIGRFANSITSAKNQLESSRNFNEGLIEDGGTIFTLSFSATGYAELDLKSRIPEGSLMTFVHGMRNLTNNPDDDGYIGDNLDDWDSAFQEQLDFLIIAADDNLQRLNEAASNIIADVQAFAELRVAQEGIVLKMENGIGILHFGYADGISQPLYTKDEIDEQCSMREWQDKTDLISVLREDTGGPDCFGSYLVFRKLEQNIALFKKEEKNLPPVLTVINKSNDELAGAMLVGRFESGRPTVQRSTGFIPNPPHISNDFDYSKDTEGLKCPFHAHTRLMNPRNGDAIAGDVSSVRITRRGIPYDEAGRFTRNESTKLTEELLDRTLPFGDPDGNLPEEKVGLLFMCYQRDIDQQFRIMQKFWANEGLIFPHEHNTHDSIIAQFKRPVAKKTLPQKWGENGQCKHFNFKIAVKNKGGEYFFTPSIPFLRSLGDNQSQSIES